MHNFTPRAQQVLALARKEADRFNHSFIGTEHLLLGLIRLGQGVAVNVLQKMGIELETVRMEVEKQVGTGPDQKMMGNIPYTPRVKKVLALAAKEAKALNHTYVGTEHILLGLLREGDGVAARVLKNLLRHRMFLVRLQTMAKNRIHVLLDRYPAIRGQRRATELFTRVGVAWLKQIELATYDRHILDSEIDLLEHLQGQIKQADTWLRQIGRKDPRVKRLESIPGIGRSFALLIVSEICPLLARTSSAAVSSSSTEARRSSAGTGCSSVPPLTRTVITCLSAIWRSATAPSAFSTTSASGVTSPPTTASPRPQAALIIA